MDKKAFAECMKRNREKQNISIENLSKSAGISVEKLMEFESGDFEKIKTSELYAISKNINVPLVVLVHGGGVCEALSREENGKTYCEWFEY